MDGGAYDGLTVYVPSKMNVLADYVSRYPTQASTAAETELYSLTRAERRARRATLLDGTALREFNSRGRAGIGSVARCGGARGSRGGCDDEPAQGAAEHQERGVLKGLAPRAQYHDFFAKLQREQRRDCETELILRGLLGDRRWEKEMSAHWRKAMEQQRFRTDRPGGMLQYRDDEGCWRLVVPARLRQATLRYFHGGLTGMHDCANTTYAKM